MANEEKLLGMGIQAANIFNALYDNSSVSIGTDTARVRDKGHVSSSVVIDCAITNKRIGLLLLDNVRDSFAIVIADKADYDAADHTVLPISDLNLHTILEYMDASFYK
ncbi:hypothetical protein ACXUPC_13965 [Pseudomonas marginalis]|uniref:hypothetical protein n=1 Tax=Pseudomonas marginalis TaxID=298 RepID=UPI0038B41E25